MTLPELAGSHNYAFVQSMSTLVNATFEKKNLRFANTQRKDEHGKISKSTKASSVRDYC